MPPRFSIVPLDQFRAIVRTLPLRSRVLVCLAAFAFFSIMGFVNDVMVLGARPGWRVAFDVLASGAMAVLYLATLVRSLRLVPLAVAVNVMVVVGVDHLLAQQTAVALAGDALRTRMAIDGAGIIVALTLGYTGAMTFTSIESARHQAVVTEIRLAGEIHESLVPMLAGTVGGFEYAGVSYPSGTVGGDLIDVVELPDGFAAYLVDVSGHGVRAGVLMGMVKSAVRMALRRPGPLGEWMTAVGEALHPLKSPSMYATMAAVQGGPSGLVFSVAGHLPILRVRAAGTVEEHTIPQVPLAMFERRTFADAPLPCEPGDLLVLLTDGITEVFDRRDRELGLEAIKAIAVERRSEPLLAIADAIVAAARSHGPQQDDQTILLLRSLVPG